MIACVDVGYREQSALAAGVVISGWEASEAVSCHTVEIAQIAEYEPGLFYKWELPCLQAVLSQLQV